jgi:rubrerythrin
MAGEAGGPERMLAAALEKEEQGRDFYKEASEKCSVAPGKELFRTLVIEEEIHIKRIRQIYESLQAGNPWTDDWKALKGINENLRNLMQDRIRLLGPEAVAAKGDLDVVKIGIQMEQGSILFYEDELKKASDPLEIDFIKKMIAEEHTHFASLEDLKLFLTDPQSWFIEKEKPTLDGA